MTSVVVRLIACVFLLGAGNSVVAQTFGKVFSTPQERAYLDRQREEMFANLDEQERLELLEQSSSIPEVLVAPQLVHLGGVVRKADGNHTVWLNGVAVNSLDLPANVVLEFQRGLGVLRIRAASGEYIVRPGQTLNADDGTIREDYELTAEEAASIRNIVAQRNSPQQSAQVDVSRQNSTPSSQNSQSEEQLEQANEMVNNILEVLRLMQEARDVQGSLQ